MTRFTWRELALIERIRWLQYVLPPVLVFIVVIYQLGVAQALERNYGHFVHYSVEIGFYSLAGPVVTWLTLVWVERRLAEKERLERQVQAAQREKAAILEEERARIARDLHDGVAQTLYFLALKADVARQQMNQNRERALADLREISQKTRQVIREVRRTIFALRPLDWSDEGFLPALRMFVTGFAEQVGWQVTMKIDDDLAIPSRLEATVFRLVQESLNNVAKHADATHIWVTLDLAEGKHQLTLTVRDNGRGFDPATASSNGLGLAQMQARVESVGGLFELHSQPGNGASITARLPLSGEENG